MNLFNYKPMKFYAVNIFVETYLNNFKMFKVSPALYEGFVSEVECLWDLPATKENKYQEKENKKDKNIINCLYPNVTGNLYTLF